MVLAAIALAAFAPSSASGYPCKGGAPAVASATGARTAQVPDCPVESPTRTRKPRRKGSAGGLTIFIFAVAGALLIPIGTHGQIRSGDPFGHDRAFYIRKSSNS